MDNKERASWFVKYWGAEMEYKTHRGIVLKGTVGVFTAHILDAIERGAAPYAKLILTHLSDISDEDAIEVAKLHYGKERESQIEKSQTRYIMNVSRSVIHNLHFVSFAIADYLRSKSYDIDNLISLGIAVRKEVGK